MDVLNMKYNDIMVDPVDIKIMNIERYISNRIKALFHKFTYK